MKTAIIYYTFGGSTKKEAERLAAELNAPIYRVKDTRERSLFWSFIAGSYYAMRRRTVPLRPLEADLQEYDRIIIGGPIWAGYPAPAFNSIVDLLPSGKEVELFFCSGGGDKQVSEQGNKELIEKKGCTVVSYRDVFTGVKPAKIKE